MITRSMGQALDSWITAARAFSAVRRQSHSSTYRLEVGRAVGSGFSGQTEVERQGRLGQHGGRNVGKGHFRQDEACPTPALSLVQIAALPRTRAGVRQPLTQADDPFSL